MKQIKLSLRIFCALAAFAMAQICAYAAPPVAPVAKPCPRPAAGSVVHNPAALFSQNGALHVNLSYQTIKDADGRDLFCFMTPDGIENPTLHVQAGDHLFVKVTNNVPAIAGGMAMQISSSNRCGAATMTSTSMNIHYHGTNTAPICHQDEVIYTMVNSGDTFQYDLAFPPDEPAGLYWYHPHIHGIAEGAVLGGASGAIIVEGIQDVQPAVAGLRHRVLMLRDQTVAGLPTPGGDVPSWDLTLNNIPIAYPALKPAVIHMQAGERQLWRFSNSSADSLVDLQVLFDGVPQNLQIVGFDGVPAGSQDGTRQGKIVNTNHILVPTAGRVEFIVAAPPSNVKNARFITLGINTGPFGDNDTQRTLATIQTLAHDDGGDGMNDDAVPSTVGTPHKQRFEHAERANITANRTLYFSEVLSNPADPASPTNFFITVDGQKPVVFDPNNPPAVITHQGAVEDWTIENRAQENHEFHFHQIHFQVLSQNNFKVNGSDPQPTIAGQYLDMIQVPYWDGNPNHPYPSVRLQMDFRGADIGDFVYHCHILGHEDNGMMAIIRVLPPVTAAKSTQIADPNVPGGGR